jgi:hypothetical protein
MTPALALYVIDNVWIICVAALIAVWAMAGKL